MRPKLGVLDFNPIQYRTPLYQRLAKRGNLELDVLFLTDHGYHAGLDPGFGVPFAWNIDLLSGYFHGFLTNIGRPVGIITQIRVLTRWVKSQDAVIVYGYAKPWMLFAMAVCRSQGIPYLMRGESHPQGQSAGIRRRLRSVVVRRVVSASAGGLAIGQLNEEFYRQYGARRVTFAPYSVDDERFARTPPVGRSELLARWGLDGSRRVIMFCGKLIPRKRPLDLIAAVRQLPCEVTTLFVGDGSMAQVVRSSLRACLTTPG